MKKLFIFLFFLLFHTSIFSQNIPYRYLISVDLEIGGSYSKAFRSLKEAQEDPILPLFGVTYDPQHKAFKLNKNGAIEINGSRAFVNNQQFEGKPRTGLEFEIWENDSDTITVAWVYWKNGNVRVVQKEVKTYPSIPEELLPGAKKPTIPKAAQEQTIHLNKALKWEDYTTLDQKIWKIGKLGNKVTVINFWFVGCKPCVEEIPELNKLVERYAKDEVEFVAFSLDPEEPIKKFLAKTPFLYNIIPNARETSDKLGINSFPTHLILDQEGKVRYYKKGYGGSIDQELGQVIDGLLEKF